MRTLIFILTLLPTIINAQTAKFYADSAIALKYAGHMKVELMEMEWRINGQVLHFGSKPIEVKVNKDKTDTLYFKKNNEAKWDTIICKIKEAKTYNFIYSTCCGGFDIEDEKGKRLVGQVNFQIEGQDNKQVYLGTLGEAGILVNPKASNILMPACRSAMSPNVYELNFSEIEICIDTSDCPETTCLYEKGKEDLIYEFGYRTISTKLDCLFLPLSNKPISVIYNPGTDRIRIE